MIRNGVEIVTDYSKYVKYVNSTLGWRPGVFLIHRPDVLDNRVPYPEVSVSKSVTSRRSGGRKFLE